MMTRCVSQCRGFLTGWAGPQCCFDAVDHSILLQRVKHVKFLHDVFSSCSRCIMAFHKFL